MYILSNLCQLSYKLTHTLFFNLSTLASLLLYFYLYFQSYHLFPSVFCLFTCMYKPIKGETRKALAVAPVLKWHYKPNPFHLQLAHQYIKLTRSIPPVPVVCQYHVIRLFQYINLQIRESILTKTQL